MALISNLYPNMEYKKKKPHFVVCRAYSRNVSITFQQRREPSQEINNLSVPALISQAPEPSQKRSRSPSSPFFPDAITFSDSKPSSETSKINSEDVTAILEDL
ncbi:hypothetical protein Tco_0649075 [Tanacetum coccineum]